MGIRLDKPWQSLDDAAIEALPGQLGVYHIADADGTVLSVGYAGAREPFGMQSALRREIEQHGGAATQFRCEFTSNCRSRWDELLMLHLADHGELPEPQRNQAQRVGRLTPPGSPADGREAAQEAARALSSQPLTLDRFSSIHCIASARMCT